MTSYLTIISLPKSFRQCFSRLIPGFVAILLLALAGVGQAGVLAWNPDTRTLVFSGPEGTRMISLDVYKLQSAWDRPDGGPTMEAVTPPAGVNSAAYPKTAGWAGWVDEVKRHNAEASKSANSIQLVFDGDSITSWFANYSGPGNSGVAIWNERYAKLGAFDFGIPGDFTQHLLCRLSQGQMDGIRPKLILLMIGTNNLGANTDEEIAEGIKAIVDAYRKLCPDAVILLQGIFPRGRLASDPIRARIKAINKILATFADGKKVLFFDLGDKFLQPDGSISAEIMRDHLHPNESGYRVWADAIQPYIDRYVTAAK